MTIFNLFFCGTLSHREHGTKGLISHARAGPSPLVSSANPFHNRELVAWLGENVQGVDYESKLTVDGVGSSNRQFREMRKFLPDASQKNDAIASATGKGWNQNVRFALAVLRKNFCTESLVHRGRFTYGGRLQAINMIGWSRGAVTCFMMANELLKTELHKIPVRIFALDPVPGMTNFDANRVTLGPNVENLKCIYARDEQSAGFDALIPHLIGKTAATYHLLPGKHATVAGNAAIDGGGGGYDDAMDASGAIARHLAIVWLRSCCAVIKTGDLGPDHLLDLYQKILNEDKKFRGLAKFQPDKKIWRSYDMDNLGHKARSFHDGRKSGLLSTTADRTQALHDEVMINQGGMFVNQHHKELFIAKHKGVGNVPRICNQLPCDSWIAKMRLSVRNFF